MADEVTLGSVPSTVNPAEVVASPTTPPAKLSEAEIFAQVSPPVEEPPAPQETPAEPVPETTPEPEPEPEELDLEAVPDEHDNFSKFKDQIKAQPELRGIIGRHAAFTEMFPDFAFAKTLHETFPDADSMEQAVSDSTEWQRVSQLLTDKPEDFPAEYAEANPQGFARMARAIPELLRQTDQREWINQRSEVVQEVLDNAARIAQNDPDMLAAIQTVAMGMNLRLGASAQVARTDPRDAEIARLRKEKEDRTTSEQEQAYQNFEESINKEFIEASLTEIETGVKNALAKANVTDAKDAAVKRIVKDVFDRLQVKLSEQPDTQKRVRDAKKAAQDSKRFSETERRSIVDYAMKRSKATLPAILREVVTEWTTSIIGAQRTKIEKQQTVAATTKDVTTAGAPAAAPPKGTTPAPQKPMTVGQKEKAIWAQFGA